MERCTLRICEVGIETIRALHPAKIVNFVEICRKKVVNLGYGNKRNCKTV